jgi:hypothetical protein
MITLSYILLITRRITILVMKNVRRRQTLQSFYSGDNEENDLLGCNAVKFCRNAYTFRSNVLPPSSGLESKPSKKQGAIHLLPLSFWLFGIIFYPEDVGDKFLLGCLHGYYGF